MIYRLILKYILSFDFEITDLQLIFEKHMVYRLDLNYDLPFSSRFKFVI